MFFPILLSTCIGYAQVGTAENDSVALHELRETQKTLLEEMRVLGIELQEAKAEAPGSERDARIDDIERRLSILEARIETLDSEIRALGGDADGWDRWSDDWDPDWSDMDTEIDDKWSWWLKDDDEQPFDIQENFFRKYPGTFPWMFPLTTRLHETIFRYNRVEGAYIGLAQVKRLFWHSKPPLVSTGSFGYGFANKTIRYSLGLYFPIYLEDQIIEIGAEGHNFTDSKDQWRFDRDENTATALFAREDFMDYFERRGYSLTASWYYRGERDWNIRAGVGYVHDTYASMNRVTNWSFFGGDKRFRINPLINDGNINSMLVSAGANNLPAIDDKTRGWKAQFSLEMAGGGMRGDFEFTQLVAEAVRYQPLNEHLNLNMRVRTGLSDGMLPVQRQFELGGPGSLPGYRYKEFSGSHVLLFNVELIIRSTLAGEARGWARNILRSSNLIFFADAGAVNDILPVATQDITRGAYNVSFGGDYSFEGLKTDLGVALGSADGVFRIGAAWRLDRSESANFIIRFTHPF